MTSMIPPMCFYLLIVRCGSTMIGMMKIKWDTFHYEKDHQSLKYIVNTSEKLIKYDYEIN